MRSASQMLLAAILVTASPVVWAQGGPELAPAPLPIARDTTGTGVDFQIGAASDGQGNSVAVWLRFTGVGEQSDLLARLFDDQGRPRGPVFQVSSDGPDDRQLAEVAMNQHGHFVVIWESFPPGGASYLRAQLFGPGGVRLGGEIQVNTTAMGVSGQATVGMDAGGNFVIAWPDASAGILVRQFNRQGRPLGPSAAVTDAGPGPFFPALAVQPGGDFTLVWVSQNATSGTPAEIVAQRFARSGEPAGARIEIHRDTNLLQQLNAAATPGGGFVVTWPSCGAGAPLECEIQARRFDGGDQPASDEIVVAPGAIGTTQAAVAADSGGGFAVAWQSCDTAFSNCTISSLAYDSSNLPAPHAAVFPAGYQDDIPAVVASPTGFIVLFDNYDCGTPDCSGNRPPGIYGWKLDFRNPPR